MIFSHVTCDFLRHKSSAVPVNLDSACNDHLFSALKKNDHARPIQLTWLLLFHPHQNYLGLSEPFLPPLLSSAAVGIVLTMLKMKPVDMRGHLTVGMQRNNSYVEPHPVSFCPSELKPYKHQSYTLIIYLKNSLPSKCKQNKLKHNRYSFFAFRRQKRERHSSCCQIYNYSSLKG